MLATAFNHPVAYLGHRRRCPSYKSGEYPVVILMRVIRRMDAILESAMRAVFETKKMLDETRIINKTGRERFKLCYY